MFFSANIVPFKVPIQNINKRKIKYISVLGMGTMWGVLFFCNHVIMAWIWMAVRLLETIDVHSGYDIPYMNPFHLLPGYAGNI